jgi:hypothetical protein
MLEELLKKYPRKATFTDCLYEIYSKPKKRRKNPKYNYVTNVLHVNDIDEYWCDEDRDDLHLGASQNLIFKRGHAFHDIVRDDLILQYPGQILGQWKLKKGIQDRPLYSELVIESEYYNYRELPVYSDYYKMIGHVDLIYMPKPNHFQITDLKTCGAKGFETLTSPYSAHRDQVTGYQILLGSTLKQIYEQALNPDIESLDLNANQRHVMEYFSGDPVLLNPVITYVCVDKIKGNPFKSFEYVIEKTVLDKVLKKFEGNRIAYNNKKGENNNE